MQRHFLSYFLSKSLKCCVNVALSYICWCYYSYFISGKSERLSILELKASSLASQDLRPSVLATHLLLTNKVIPLFFAISELLLLVQNLHKDSWCEYPINMTRYELSSFMTPSWLHIIKSKLTWQRAQGEKVSLRKSNLFTSEGHSLQPPQTQNL